MYLGKKKKEILQRRIDWTEFLRVCELWMKYGERNIIDNSLYDIKLEVPASVARQIVSPRITLQYRHNIDGRYVWVEDKFICTAFADTTRLKRKK